MDPDLRVDVFGPEDTCRAADSAQSMHSRRRLLTGLAGGAVVGSVLGTRVSIGSVASWAPPDDSWPLRRFDPANTASNLAVAAPANPEVAWRERVLDRSEYNTLVVGPSRVYAASDAAREPPHSPVVALDRADGNLQWTGGLDAGSLALFRGRLYAGPADDGVGTIRVHDAETGERVGEAETAGIGERGHLVPTPDGVFLGTGNVLTARDRDGTPRWRHASRGQGVPVVAGGSLYAVGYDAVQYDSRTLADVPTGGRPEVAWRTVYDAMLTTVPPAVLDGTLLAPGAVPTASADPDAENGRAPLAGIDTGSGTVDWRAFADGARPDGTATGTTGVVRTTALAGDGRRAFAGVTSGERSDRRHAVRAAAPGSGEESFTLPSNDWIADLAVVGTPTAEGGTAERTVLLVATAADWGNDRPTEAGTIRAFDASRAEELWQVSLRSPVRAVAPVAGAVFGVLLDGSVVKLADSG